VVQRFMDKHVTPALEEAAVQLRSQGLDVQTLLGSAKRCMGVRVEMEEGNPFVYEVSLDGYLAAPSESIEADEEKCAAVTTGPRCTCTTAARSTT
jgi:choline/glycine/proline betaine transport protein